MNPAPRTYAWCGMNAHLAFGLLLLGVIGGAGLHQAQQTENTSALHLLDVGQGDAILLRAGNVDVLVDGGPDATVVRRLGELRPAWDRRLEIVILTHPDLDHVGGLPAVFEREDVGLLVLPAIAAENSLFRTVLTTAAERAIPVRFARPGQRISAGDLTLTVLAPDAQALRLARRKPNNGGAVLRADVKAANIRCLQIANIGCLQSGFSALLTADIERAAEHLLVQRAGKLLDVDVLKVGHHGSKTSTSRRLLAATTPALAIISSGAGNRYGHPHPAVLRRLRGARVLRTDHSGTISLFVRGARVFLRCAGECSEK